jgi:hypothetical protein
MRRKGWLSAVLLLLRADARRPFGLMLADPLTDAGPFGACCTTWPPVVLLVVDPSSAVLPPVADTELTKLSCCVALCYAVLPCAGRAPISA